MEEEGAVRRGHGRTVRRCGTTRRAGRLRVPVCRQQRRDERHPRRGQGSLSHTGLASPSQTTRKRGLRREKHRRAAGTEGDTGGRPARRSVGRAVSLTGALLKRRAAASLPLRTAAHAHRPDATTRSQRGRRRGRGGRRGGGGRRDQQGGRGDRQRRGRHEEGGRGRGFGGRRDQQGGRGDRQRRGRHDERGRGGRRGRRRDRQGCGRDRQGGGRDGRRGRRAGRGCGRGGSWGG